MTLELSDDEVRALMHLANLAMYVAEASQDSEAAEEVENMQELVDRILEAGAAEGYRGVAQYEPSEGHWMPTEEYVNNSVYKQIVRDFEDDFFWNELAAQLAERDVRVKGGDRMETDEREQRLLDLQDSYMDMFTDHGVDRLHVIPPSPHQ